MPTPRKLVWIVVVSLLLGVSVNGVWAADSPAVTAVLDGRPIPLDEVARYHCHDGANPIIRCFETQRSRDVDAGLAGSDVTRPLAEPTAATPSLAQALFYVTWWEHADYGGSSFTTSLEQSNLGSIGWNDRITSFKSLNGQRPRWWEHASFTGTYWYWAAGAWVSNVGDGANDRFSSVKNVP